MNESLWTYVLIGFAAQLVDGSLGMAYGVISTGTLLALGWAPASAIAIVRLTKVVIGAASGLAHLWLGNVLWPLCRRLVVPGTVGGILGAVLVSEVPGDVAKPVIAAYLSAIGVVLVAKGFDFKPRPAAARYVGTVGFAGGFIDSLGGGWGPLVTTTLMTTDHQPKHVIGSVNIAEFFVAVAQSVVFFSLLGVVDIESVSGLVIGGVLAAPLAATLTKLLPAKWLMFLVGGVVFGLGVWTLSVAVL